VYLRQKSDFEVLAAQSAKEALEILSECEVDVIVADYQMPGMNGLQLLREIRNKGNDIPFIMFTARDSKELAIEALNCGADFFVKKGGGGDVRSMFTELISVMEHAVIKRRGNLADHET